MERAGKSPDSPHRRAAAERTAAPRPAVAHIENRPEAVAQRKLIEKIHRSPRVAAQRRLSAAIDGSPYVVAQRMRVPPSLPGRVIQCDVVDNADSRKVLLDRFNRAVESIQVITAALYEKLWRSDKLGELTFDQLYERVEKVFPAMAGTIADPRVRISLADFVEKQFVHEEWLQSAGGTKMHRHEEMLDVRVKNLFGHYNLFDDNMVWRFTSTPSSETVYIAPETSHEEIASVVAAHSGGNDKSNPKVKTLSFGRNVGALLGVAASEGGDKRVLNIIDKTEYLYGIDITTLAAKGISAHPATARMISLFETEYVLVSTPGDKARSLDDLATVKYKNPFRQKAITLMLGAKRSEKMTAIEKQMGTVKPQTVESAIAMDQQLVTRILAFAHKAAKAASAQSGSVQDKEQIENQQQIEKAMTRYHAGLK